MKTVQQLGLLLWLMPWIAVHANTVIRFPLSTRVIEAAPIIEDLKYGFKPTLPYFQLRELNAPLPPFWFSLKYVSKIKDQGERGTCTIFTTLDSIESTLKSYQ